MKTTPLISTSCASFPALLKLLNQAPEKSKTCPCLVTPTYVVHMYVSMCVERMEKMMSYQVNFMYSFLQYFKVVCGFPIAVIPPFPPSLPLNLPPPPLHTLKDAVPCVSTNT